MTDSSDKSKDAPKIDPGYKKEFIDEAGAREQKLIAENAPGTAGNVGDC